MWLDFDENLINTNYVVKISLAHNNQLEIQLCTGEVLVENFENEPSLKDFFQSIRGELFHNKLADCKL